MTDRDPNPSQSPAPSSPPYAANRVPYPRSKRGRTALFATLVVVAGLTGAAITNAVSSPFGFGPGWGGPGMHWRSEPLSPVMIEERADRMIRHLAVELDASNEQQDKLRGIMRAMLKDVLPARETAEAARRQARDLLTQPTIDRGALEKLRTEQIALADSVSKRAVQALGDAAEVLSVEQRRKLNDRLPPFAGRPGWRRG